MSLADKRNETAKKIILEVQSGMIQAFNVAHDTSYTSKIQACWSE